MAWKGLELYVYTPTPELAILLYVEYIVSLRFQFATRLLSRLRFPYTIQRDTTHTTRFTT
jgi:hypothetical protein